MSVLCLVFFGCTGSSLQGESFVGCGMWDLSSPTRDGTRVPCVARQTLNLWTTREIPLNNILHRFDFENIKVEFKR